MYNIALGVLFIDKRLVAEKYKNFAFLFIACAGEFTHSPARQHKKLTRTEKI